MRRFRWLALLCGAGLLLSAGMAQAKPRKRARRAIRMGPLEVKGRVQLPQAFYVLPRSSLNFKVLKLKESFIPSVLESVKKKPF